MGSFRLEFVQKSADEMLSQQRQDALAQFIIEGWLADPVQEERAVLEAVTIGERTYSRLRHVILDDRPLEFKAQECKIRVAKMEKEE
jgi:hypothetical protein